MSTPTGYTHVCRECRTNLTGTAYLRLGKDSLRGPTSICLSCLDRLMGNGKYGHPKTIRDFVVTYVAANRTERQTVKDLTARVQELERLLETVTRPPNSNVQTYTVTNQ